MKNMTHSEVERECDRFRVPQLWERWWLAVAVLMISLGMTFAAKVQSNRQVSRRAEEKFRFQTNRVREQVEQRMQIYAQVLRGGQALFNSTSHVTREQWSHYAASCQVQRWFPGIQALGVAVPVTSSEKQDFETRVRSEGFPSFSITPADERHYYTAIKFIEPFDWRNERAFGFDMWSDPVRRAAMKSAIETGRPSMSGKITLVQETSQDIQAGFLCYLPLYEKNLAAPESGAVPASSVGNKTTGWIYAAFRCEDLMEGILGTAEHNVSIEIYDTDELSEANLLYASENAERRAAFNEQDAFCSVVPIDVSGRPWSLRFKSDVASLQPDDKILNGVITATGTVISVLLFGIVASIAQRRESALLLARRMTKELRETDSYTRSILENASEAILTVNEDGSIVAENLASRSVFGSSKSLIGTNLSRLFANESIESLRSHRDSDDGEAGKPVVGQRVNDEFFPCRVQIDHIKESDPASYVVILRDETMRAENARILEEKNQELIDASRMSGKAEVITGVLHNVGNVLNSINVAAHLIRTRMDASPVEHLTKASVVINEHQHSLGDFFENDSKGQVFPNLLTQLASKFEEDHDAQRRELKEMTDHISHVKEIVSLQQSAAKSLGNMEPIEAARLFEDALKMNLAGLRHRGIDVKKNYENVPRLQTRKHDVLQILVNLIRNANQAVDMSTNGEKVILLSIEGHDDQVCFSVSDSGVGIPQENMDCMFQHGFTTKKDGHGFGLHSCANTARELGGKMSVKSDGEEKGATFTLTLPLAADVCLLEKQCSKSETTKGAIIDGPPTFSPDCPA